VVALHLLLQQSYDEYKASMPDGQAFRQFAQWCEQRCTESPQFQYWLTVMEFQMLLLTFIRSLRQRDFKMYKDSLCHIIPWFFALDHQNYARWLSVHARDMEMLHSTHPDMANHFENGKFVVTKSNAPFSAIAIDHAHEQNNAVMKGDGGTIGLTENPTALKRWMIGGPEFARLISEFQEVLDIEDPQKRKHHEQMPSKQKTFLREVQALSSTIAEMGNPFSDSSGDLYSLNDKDVADDEVIKTVRTIQKLGQDKYQNFVTERLVTEQQALVHQSSETN
jgi:hypothetical protein